MAPCVTSKHGPYWVPAPPQLGSGIPKASRDSSFEQPQFDRSGFVGEIPGSTDEKVCCRGGDISCGCLDWRIGSRPRWRCCPGRSFGSRGVRARWGRCGRVGWIYGWTFNCSFVGIERISLAQQAIPDKNPRGGDPQSRSRRTGAHSKHFAAAGSGAGSTARSSAGSAGRSGAGRAAGSRL